MQKLLLTNNPKNNVFKYKLYNEIKRPQNPESNINSALLVLWLSFTLVRGIPLLNFAIARAKQTAR